MVGVVYPGLDAGRRHPVLGPQPAHPAGERGLSERRRPTPAIDPVGDVTVALGPPRDDARLARKRAPAALLVRSKTFMAGAIIVGFWVLCAIFGKPLVPQDPFASSPLNGLERAVVPTTGSAPTGSAATCSRGSSSARATS